MGCQTNVKTKLVGAVTVGLALRALMMVFAAETKFDPTAFYAGKDAKAAVAVLLVEAENLPGTDRGSGWPRTRTSAWRRSDALAHVPYGSAGRHGMVTYRAPSTTPVDTA